MRFAAFVLGLLLLVRPALAETEPVLRMLNFGEIIGREVGGPDRVTSSGDRLRNFEGATVIRRTNQIEARLCRRFGMLFLADNLAPGEIVAVTIRAEHPGVRHPDGRVSTGTSYTSAVMAARPGYVGFTFDDEWELVPGTWSFAVLFHDKVLLEERFEVTLAADGGGALPGACESLTS